MKIKALSAFSVMLFLIFTLLSACSSDSTGKEEEKEKDEEAKANFNEEGFPIVNDQIKLTFVAPSSDSPDWNDILIYNTYKEMTNVDIDWQMISQEGLKEKTNLMLAGGDYPDAFHSVGLSTQDLITYGGQGVLVPLNDLIDKYAPNFKKILEENPDIKRGITMPDGNIYSFPRIYEPDFDAVLANWKLWINEDFLNALNMEEPMTLDEFYDYLKAAVNNDPNGNGKADEIGISASGDGHLINIFKGSFGLGNRGIDHKYVDMDPETNELRFFPIHDGYKEMLQYLNKLYSEGLIIEDLYTVKSEETHARGADGLFAATVTTNPQTGYGRDEYIGAVTLEGPHGDKLHSNYGSSLNNVGGFAITDKNQYPEETIRWIDYFYSDEGSRLFFMGVEGETYVENEDGTVEYTDLIENNPDGLTRTEAISKYLTWRAGPYPAFVKRDYFGVKTSNEAAEKFKENRPKEIWPPFNFTNEESEIMSSVGTDIEDYITESQAKFITGKTSFDEWDKYVETVKKVGLDQYMEIYQDGYNRYLEQAK
ncbi:ABC transporter substrate-binding protein [Virgibacillus soli]|uniref:extracellular solute-binding protein n=1 Tax=Lederbergia galactosidilytica TaxID=217031 RepID=UPI000715B673|nr:extracellular solute-binding protein [Lederbergia galactosidilytica]KRG13827.1 ABC transporter substrate-binding protein [Virgibacillus soli]MBP1914120.1 putative aldouronate transport system substrate-binding protein [Lederbergia galactosidilytica]